MYGPEQREMVGDGGRKCPIMSRLGTETCADFWTGAILRRDRLSDGRRRAATGCNVQACARRGLTGRACPQSTRRDQLSDTANWLCSLVQIISAGGSRAPSLLAGARCNALQYPASERGKSRTVSAVRDAGERFKAYVASRHAHLSLVSTSARRRGARSRRRLGKMPVRRPRAARFCG